jgi:membrane protease YdiL (CAAX protease family)
MTSPLFSATNPLVDAAQARRRPTPVWAVFLLVPLVTVATFEFNQAFTYWLLFSGYPSPTEEPTRAAAAQVVELLTGFAAIALLLWLWLRFFERRPFSTLGLRRTGALRKVLRGALFGLLLVAATALLLAILGFVVVEGDAQVPVGLAALGGVLFVAVGWAAQATSEELLCRGWALQTAATRYGTLIGVLFSSLVFALFHLYQADVGLLALMNLFLLGVLLALYALYEESLWGVCAFHAAYNWTETSLLGFDYYGEEAAGGMLLNLRQVGPDVVTGGGVGVSTTGGLGQTATILLGIATLRLFASRRPATATATTKNRVR